MGVICGLNNGALSQTMGHKERFVMRYTSRRFTFQMAFKYHLCRGIKNAAAHCVPRCLIAGAAGGTERRR